MTSGIRYAHNGDVDLAYQVVGDGPLDLAFVPGFVFHQELVWEYPPVRRFFERLASFSRLILWDKREQGLSDRLGQPPTLEQSMDDLRAVLDAAGSERPALFGVSEGGPMTSLFAATHPERVRSLVLYGSWARILESDDYPEGQPREELDRFMAIASDNWGGPAVAEFFAPSMAGDDRFLAFWARILRAGSSPRGARELIRMYYDVDVREVLPTLSAPALVVQRSDDRVATPRQGRVLSQLIPDSRFVEIPGGDHLFFEGDTEALLDEVESFLTGTQAEREPERSLLTVLFTDIVGSTKRAAELGDRRWRDLLAEHDAVAARTLEEYRGRLVKTMGDGILATFDGPARAIRCARAFLTRARELGVRLRAGLHTGEAELLGDDVGGLAVHIGARASAAAGADEVIVTRTVVDLVAGSGLEFEDRGEHELKGVPGLWRLLAVKG